MGQRDMHFINQLIFITELKEKTINPPKYLNQSIINYISPLILNQSIIRPNVIVRPDVAYLKVLM